MRIMQVISGGDVNGAIVHCAQLSRELIARGHALTLVCRPQAWVAGQLRPLGAECVESSLARWPTTELRRIARLVRERRIDVIHTHMSRANAFGVLLKYLTGAPCVATAHNRYVQLHWRFNDHVIGSSAATTAFHRRFNLVPPRKLTTIHYFIDVERATRTSPGARQRIRRELAIGDEDVLVGQIGDVIPRKGLLHLVRALADVLPQAPQVRLAVVGAAKDSDDYYRKTRAEAERLGVAGAIRWLGHRHDVADVLSALDVAALASLEESFPLSILEAMSARLPVVASAVGGLPECIDDGVTGYLVPPAKPQSLALAIVRLAHDAPLRTQLGQSARQALESRLSAAAIVPKVEAVYEQVQKRRAAA